MIIKLLTEHHLEFLSFKRGCIGSSVSTLVKMPHCWKSHATAQIPMPIVLLNMELLKMEILDSFKKMIQL